MSDPAHRYTAREVATHPWTTGDTDQNASRPPNVLALMKNFAKMKNADDLVSRLYLAAYLSSYHEKAIRVLLRARLEVTSQSWSQV